MLTGRLSRISRVSSPDFCASWPTPWASWSWPPGLDALGAVGLHLAGAASCAPAGAASRTRRPRPPWSGPRSPCASRLLPLQGVDGLLWRSASAFFLVELRSSCAISSRVSVDSRFAAATCWPSCPCRGLRLREGRRHPRFSPARRPGSARGGDRRLGRGELARDSSRTPCSSARASRMVSTRSGRG